MDHKILNVSLVTTTDSSLNIIVFLPVQLECTVIRLIEFVKLVMLTAKSVLKFVTLP